MVDLLGFDDIGIHNSSPLSIVVEEDPNYFIKHFWGEKYQGFQVLCNNLKHGQASAKALQDFIRERVTTEDTYAKHLTKLAKSATQNNANNLGTFSPMFDILRSMSEKLSACHMDTVIKLNDIIKELVKYQEEHKSKQKQMKEQINVTQDALHLTHTTAATALKSKEKYHHLCMSIERMKAYEGTVNAKELEKTESKAKKAADDYKAHVEKHKKSRIDFEDKMTESSKKFQNVEEFHLGRMKLFLDNYVQSCENASILIGQVHREIQTKVNENSVRSLVKQYSENKGTGVDRPAPLTFEECDPSSPVLISIDSSATTASQGSTQNGVSEADIQHKEPAPQPQTTTKPSRLPLGLPFRRKNKAKHKKRSPSSNGKDVDKDSVSVESPEKDRVSVNVDEEGYTIRPEVNKQEPGSTWSSDDSSDSEDGGKFKKIQIKIKPIEETSVDASGNLEVLNAITQKLTLNAPNSLALKKSPLSGSAKSSSSRKLSSISSTSSGQLLDLFPPSSATSPAAVPRPMSSLSVTTPVSSSTSPLTTGGGGRILEDFFATDASTAVKMLEPSDAPDTSKTSATAADDAAANGFKQKASSSASLNNCVTPDSFPGGTAFRGNSGDESNMTWPSRKSTGSNIESTFTTDRKALNAGAPLAESESWSSMSSSGATTPSFDITSGFNSVSRGPSPLTLGHSDTIPIAVAFSETIDAQISQSADAEKQYFAKVSGEVQVSFPHGIVRTLATNPNPPTLSFKIRGLPTGVDLKLNSSLLLQDSSFNENGTSAFWFNMSELKTRIKNMYSKNSGANYYNLPIMNYQIGPMQNPDLLPLHFALHSKNDSTTASFDVRYSYNPKACTSPIRELKFILPVNLNVTNVQSTPSANWKEQRLSWNLPSPLTQASGESTLKAQLALDEPSLSSPQHSPMKIAAVFVVEGSIVSGADFELLSGSGYRISLIKRRLRAGKYFSTSTT